MPKPLVILKVGSTEPQVRARRGDFEDWFQAGMGFGCEELQVCALHLGERPPALDEVLGAVVTGSSAMLTNREPWSVLATQWIAELVESSAPLLAICYGHQLLAQAAGGRVGWNPAGREIGTVDVELLPPAQDDPLLHGLGSPLAVQESHSQSVLELPPGAVHLARNAHDPAQGFRVGEHAWGLQFHPEFDADIVRGYLESRRATIASEGLDVDSLLKNLADTPRASTILKRFGELVRARRSASTA